RGVLNQSANAVYEGLPDDDHRLAMQQLMLRTISVEGGHLARRRVPLIELDFASDRQNEQVREVRARMEAAYLLVPDEAAGRPYVEPAHDALVRHWDKMAEWQRMAGDSLPFQRR